MNIQLTNHTGALNYGAHPTLSPFVRANEYSIKLEYNAPKIDAARPSPHDAFGGTRFLDNSHQTGVYIVLKIDVLFD